MYPCHKAQNYLKNSEYDANPNDWLIDWLDSVGVRLSWNVTSTTIGNTLSARLYSSMDKLTTVRLIIYDVLLL